MQSDGTIGWFINGVYLKHQKATKKIKTAHRDAQLGNGIVRLLGPDLLLREVDEDTSMRWLRRRGRYNL